MNIKVNVNDSKTLTTLKLVSQRTPLVDKGTGNVPISLAPAPAFKWSLRRNSLNTMDG
jgi:hypothetical protein